MNYLVHSSSTMAAFKRYQLLYSFILIFLLGSFLIRTCLLTYSFAKANLSITSILKLFGLGLFFDVGVAFFIILLYALYLFILPQRFNNSKFNRLFTYFGFFVITLIVIFSFFAEVTFWEEFESRFNFIAVDYLVYTYEVINNINESYPLPILVGSVLLLCTMITWFCYKKNVFLQVFHSATRFRQRLLVTIFIMAVCAFYALFVKNSLAESGDNRYQSELSKAGIYSFVAAFKNNELDYDAFYAKLDIDQAFNLVRRQWQEPGITFIGSKQSLLHNVPADTAAMKPNVIMVTIESFSAAFMGSFGNTQHLTPVLDSLAREGTLFTNMYATGNRTVRGMEALSLAIPPTPGNSIVRRPGNDKLLTIGYIFNQHGYETSFLYGGDGYFDNMNNYFGNNGYNIVDRGRNLVKDDIKSSRTIIPDSLVHFENAWGICDGDLYDAVIRSADKSFQNGNLFYDFVMTTSNHRPFTFPAGKIDMPTGSREAAIKYTDYAIGAFLEKAALKPWFNNTTFIFVADHCASSAGKNEINIDKYHIPCIVYTPSGNDSADISVRCSQIDLYPTLFAKWGWNYTSSLYGMDVTSPGYKPRILLGTYQKLGYIKGNSLVVLSPQQKAETYFYNEKTNEQTPTELDKSIVNEAIAQYQSAAYLFKKGGLKQ